MSTPAGFENCVDKLRRPHTCLGVRPQVSRDVLLKVASSPTLLQVGIEHSVVLVQATFRYRTQCRAPNYLVARFCLAPWPQKPFDLMAAGAVGGSHSLRVLPSAPSSPTAPSTLLSSLLLHDGKLLRAVALDVASKSSLIKLTSRTLRWLEAMASVGVRRV